MASLINMEMSTAEATAEAQPSVADAPKYPWGLCLTLNNESLEKLNVKSLPPVGTEVTIVAKAQVSRISDYQTQGNESEASMDLQITDLQIDGLDADVFARAAEMLYGKK